MVYPDDMYYTEHFWYTFRLWLSSTYVPHLNHMFTTLVRSLCFSLGQWLIHLHLSKQSPAFKNVSAVQHKPAYCVILKHPSKTQDFLTVHVCWAVCLHTPQATPCTTRTLPTHFRILPQNPIQWNISKQTNIHPSHINTWQWNPLHPKSALTHDHLYFWINVKTFFLLKRFEMSWKLF